VPAWITMALMVLQLLPMIAEAVKWIESAAAGQTGAFKKDQVLAFLKAILQGTMPFSKLDQATVDAILAMAGPLIDMIVGLFNATGVFVKKTP
jgi:hypothetical protein